MTTTQLDVKQIGESFGSASDPFHPLREQIHTVFGGSGPEYLP